MSQSLAGGGQVGILNVTDHAGKEGNSDDIKTTRSYANFEPSVEFAITRGANRGLKYSSTSTKRASPSALSIRFSTTRYIPTITTIRFVQPEFASPSLR